MEGSEDLASFWVPGFYLPQPSLDRCSKIAASTGFELGVQQYLFNDVWMSKTFKNLRDPTDLSTGLKLQRYTFHNEASKSKGDSEKGLYGDEEDFDLEYFSESALRVQEKPKPDACKWTLHSNGIDVNGRLPAEAPYFAEEVASMEEESTQPSTQPYGHLDLSSSEEKDLICTLHPCSRPAFDIAEKIAEYSPQHVMQNVGLSHKLQDVIELADDHEADKVSTKHLPRRPEPNVSASDIALRLSSRIHDLDMGFVFGRDPEKCDIVIQLHEGDKIRVSSRHFRIYLTEGGVIMLEDTSMNGTVVDGCVLKQKDPHPGAPVRRMLSHGSIIELFVSDNHATARFVVILPNRLDESEWKARLYSYILEVQKVREAKAAAMRRLDWPDDEANERLPTTTPYHDTMQCEPSRQTVDQNFITAGTARGNHGMHWNGGGVYSVLSRIGQGAFAIVYKLATITDGHEYACKEIEKRRFMKDGVLDQKIANELRIMRHLNHPHVITSFGHRDEPKHLYILMEYMGGSDLGHQLGVYGRLPEQDAKLVAKQMCHALAYLHDRGIAHRDIKPENILKKQTSPLWVKLADFGLSKIVTNSDQTVYQTFCGTLLYCAPEIYPGFDLRRAGLPPDPKLTKPSPYSTAVDIWSLGAVIWHLVCGKAPYEAPAANHGAHMLEAILKTRFPYKKLEVANVSADWDTFLWNTLQIPAHVRWSARRLLSIPWLQRTPDVVAVDYRFRSANHELAIEEDSSDQGTTGVTSEIADGDDAEDGDLDASLLSLNELDFESDDGCIDASEIISGAEIPSLKESKDGVNNFVETDKRYNLHNRETAGNAGQYPSPPIFSSRTQRVRRQISRPAGHLFGEISESSIFDDVLTQVPIQSRSIITGACESQSESSVTGSYVENSLTPVKRGLHKLRTTGSAPSLHGAEGAIGQLRMGSPESDISVSANIRTSPQASKRNLDDESKQNRLTSTKRPRTSHTTKGTASRGVSKVHGQASAVEVTDTLDRHRNGGLSGHNASDGNVLSARTRGVTPITHVAREAPPDLNFVRTASLLGLATSDTVASMSTRHDVISAPGAKQTASSNLKHHHRTRPYANSPEILAPLAADGITPLLGKLTPDLKSIPTADIEITKKLMEWGRAPTCTNIYENTMDIRIPKSGITIHLHDPANYSGSKKDWSKSDFYAIIGTRCSGYILVNDIPLTRNKGMTIEQGPLGLLHSGDVIEIFKDGKSHLRFQVTFYYGVCKEPRGSDFKVYLGQQAILSTIATDYMMRTHIGGPMP